ncbi:MAG: hypothetical protein A4E28_00267 [Methanocella sp. PtaU1.Bin125]|nr:MAG: hypothetical protein A4E28_00267 [Methanocella sp. PtaU1.Bin125]
MDYENNVIEMGVEYDKKNEYQPDSCVGNLCFSNDIMLDAVHRNRTVS